MPGTAENRLSTDAHAMDTKEVMVTLESQAPVAAVTSVPPPPAASGPRRGLAARVLALTDPSPVLTDPGEILRARILASVLVLGVAIGLAGVASFAALRRPAYALEVPFQALVVAALAGAYLLSRTVRWRAAAWLAIGVVITHSLVIAGAATEPIRVQAGLTYTVLGVLLSAIVLPPRATVGLGLADLAAVVAVGVLHPAFDGAALQDAVFLTGTCLAVFCVLAVLSQHFVARLGAATKDLQRSEARFHLAARGANDGLWDWDMSSGDAWFSPRWAQILGIDIQPDHASLSLWLDRVHPDDAPRLRSDLSAHIAALTPAFENTHRIRRADGTYRWAAARGVAVRDDDGRVERMAGSITDVTEQKQFEEQLLHDAFHDVLSGLPNRALFLNRLAHSIARAHRRSTYLFAVLFLDLDRFKIINDSLGHRAGDQLLVQMARRLEGCVRPGDTVARLGGDEFTILLDDIETPRDAEIVADRILAALRQPFMMERQEIVTSASIGIALSTTGYTRPEDLIRDADTAMYKAKAEGKARHVLFDRKMHEAAVAQLKLEADLRRAVARDEFVLHYQPIISLQNGSIEGFEALVRWRHPERGLVYPNDFIPIAEETGIINALGWSVLRNACEQIRIWRESFRRYEDLSLNVNLSGRQFRQPDLVRGIVSILSETGLDPQALNLEITETVVMESAQESHDVLARLRAHGVRMCIDDFGTGYSSLNYLHDFDIDSLKIDRSFVGRMAAGSRPEIVQTIVDLSRSLGMSVTAEGVETDEELAQLRELDCELAQGFLFARPLPPEEVERLLARDPIW